MKTTIELPTPLFRRAKILAARRGTTLRALVVEGLQHVTDGTPPPAGNPSLTAEETTVATLGAHGLPVLKRPARSRTKVTRALVDRIRDELSL